MKHTTIVSLIAYHLSVITLSAAVPLRWTVETSRATPATFEAYQGETIALEAALMSYGKPLEASGIAALYWQTNGMGSTYWETTAAVNSNRLSAVFTPEMDVGAKVYNCFIGQPGTIYHAAFQLRLRPSPGATPNVLPLPVPVIDFAKVRVLNPPWESGGGGGVNTNAVIDIIHETVDGAARPLPKYLHLYDADDSYPDAAAEYYRSRGNGKTEGGCSSVRDGGFLYRNFDYPFDDRAEFVVKMSAGPNRFASVGVAQVGTNLTEQMVTSGKPEYSRLYKWLPGATVDGINENGVACNINVVDGDPQTSGWHTTGSLHPLAAIRWILDNATNAQSAAEYIAANIRFPQGWTQNFHYMICDAESTYIVENGEAVPYGNTFVVMTNHGMFNPPAPGPGIERDSVLRDGANITNVWYTNAYRRETNPPWVSDLAEVIAYTNDIFDAWASHPKEYFRGKTTNGIPWWQTVHTSIYDLANRVLRVSVQETDDWYVFSVPPPLSAVGVDEGRVREIVEPMVKSATNDLSRTLTDSFDTKLDGKLSTNVEGGGEIRWGEVGDLEIKPESSVMVLSGNVQVLDGDVQSNDGTRYHSLFAKANRPADFYPSEAGNIAVLDENGDLSDGGKRPGDFRETTDNTCRKTQLGEVWTCNPSLPSGWYISYGDSSWFVTTPTGLQDSAPKVDVNKTATSLSWEANEWNGGYAFTATRGAAAREGEVF